MADVHRLQIDDSTTDARTTAVARAADAPLGRWGHLLLVKKIGEGTFGEVYEAIDTWLDHRRALKLLKPHIGDAASAHQILHEARKLVRVRHPNVVMVHGADKHDGRVGFWMDLIEGHTLEERVGHGRLSAGEATYIGQEVCSALAAVHQADLVHRDVKAQNVMRASDGGRIILMDFGAGEFRSARSEGPTQGTPLYLAPEMFAGTPASAQSDIYALGTLLFYLVSGRFPVEGNPFPRSPSHIIGSGAGTCGTFARTCRTRSCVSWNAPSIRRRASDSRQRGIFTRRCAPARSWWSNRRHRRSPFRLPPIPCSGSGTRWSWS